MKKLNVIEFDIPILTRDTKLSLYNFGQKLLRLCNSMIVAHPHTMLHSTILLTSPAPFVYRQGNKIRLYSILAPNKNIELGQELNSDALILPFTENSIVMLSQQSTLARVIAVSSSGEFEYSNLEHVKYIMPQGLFSYIIDTKNRLLFAKELSHIEHIMNCQRVEYAEFKSIKLIICYNQDEKSVILSDGLYGDVYEFQGNNFEHIINATWYYNTMAFNTDRGTYLAGFDHKRKFLYETSYHIENPVHVYNGVFLGKAGNYLALYNAEKDELKILSLKASAHTKVWPCEEIAAIVEKDGVMLLDLESEKILKLRKVAHDIVLASSRLLLLNKNKLSIYALNKVKNTFTIEMLYEGPSALVSCTGNSNKEVVCVDILGRIIVLPIDDVLRIQPRIHKCRCAPYPSMLTLLYIPGYPLKIVPSEGIHITFQRYNAITSEIIIKTVQKYPITLNMVIYGIVNAKERSIELQPSFPFRASSAKVYYIEKLTLINNTPIVCNKEVKHALKKCLETLLFASKDSFPALCVDESASSEDFKEEVIEPSLVIVKNIVKVDVHPIVDLKRRIICFYPPTLQNIELKLEVFCKSQILTLESGCIKLDGDCDFLTMTITARSRDGDCENRVPMHYNIEAELFHHDVPEALMEQGVLYKLVLPHICVAIPSAKIIYDSDLQLHAVIKNLCHNLALTILMQNSAYILTPGSEKALTLSISLDDIIRGGKVIGVIEPVKASVLMFPINLPYLLWLAHQVALKISASIGLGLRR
ncbi:MAG: hypothetical protein LM583_00455 [Desulfurococcaceae archaeon]|nr:hypothetical protein [Desulfurococcaceae archaeon]